MWETMGFTPTVDNELKQSIRVKYIEFQKTGLSSFMQTRVVELCRISLFLKAALRVLHLPLLIVLCLTAEVQRDRIKPIRAPKQVRVPPIVLIQVW